MRYGLLKFAMASLVLFTGPIVAEEIANEDVNNIREDILSEIQQAQQTNWEEAEIVSVDGPQDNATVQQNAVGRKKRIPLYKCVAQTGSFKDGHISGFTTTIRLGFLLIRLPVPGHTTRGPYKSEALALTNAIKVCESFHGVGKCRKTSYCEKRFL